VSTSLLGYIDCKGTCGYLFVSKGEESNQVEAAWSQATPWM
jgi:hypothetical protein